MTHEHNSVLNELYACHSCIDDLTPMADASSLAAPRGRGRGGPSDWG